MRIRLLTLMILLVSAPLQGNEQCAVRLELDRHECLIGDWLQLEVSVESTAGYHPLWPDWETQQLGSFRVLQAEQLNPAQQRLTVAVYDLDRQVLPSFSFPFIDLRDSTTFALQTDSLVVQVFSVSDSLDRSLLPADTAATPLIDIYPPGERPLTWREWLLYGVITAAALLLLLLPVYFWRRRGSGEAITAAELEKQLPPPGERARAELQRIRADKLWQRGEVVEYYFRITLLLRRYLEWQTGDQVAEMTTTEVESFLQELGSPQPAPMLLQLLQQGDLVKFASQLPPDVQHEQYWEAADELLTVWIEWFAAAEAAADQVEAS